MESRLIQKRFVYLLPIFVLLAGCDRVPDCDSNSTRELMEKTVYRLVKSSLAETRPSGVIATQNGSVVEVSARHQAMMDMYHPYVAIAVDKKWLRLRLEAEAPEALKGDNFRLYLMLKNFKVVRDAVNVKLSNFVQLPDRVEGARTYRKVCRATLTITPTAQSLRTFEPIELTYSANPKPTSSRTSAANPIYIPINFFEATEPPLPFELSDSEKVVLIAMGATKDIRAIPRSQSPDTRITRQALRAFRASLEGKHPPAMEAPNPSIERTSPGKPGAASQVKR